MANNRELSQLASFVTVDDTSKTISFASTIASLNVTGVGTFASLAVGGVTVSTATIANPTVSSLTVSGISTLGVTSTTNLTAQQLNVSGISTLGVTSATNLTAQQLNVSGVSTLTTLNGTSGLVSLASTIKTKGFVETQSTVSIAGTILTLDASQGTFFTHTTSAPIGIVSFAGIRTDTASAQTFSVLMTQGATPVNTTGVLGIGTQLASIRITPGDVGIATYIRVGSGNTIILTNSAGALDLLTFIVSYDGTATITNANFKVVAFASTDFRNAVTIV